MTLDDYNGFCGGLAHAGHVVQWGGAHVWKVDGRVFAIATWSADNVLAVTFKCSPLTFDLLRHRQGLHPAPYLASRGLSWIQRHGPGGMDDGALQDYLRESHRLASLNLSKRRQRQLALNQLS